jgi:hypothetical protein
MLVTVLLLGVVGVAALMAAAVALERCLDAGGPNLP